MNFPGCPTPCRRIEIRTQLQNKINLNGNDDITSGVDLIFDTSVKVSQSRQVTYWFDLLCSIGGLLGLFLGVSLLQIWDILIGWMNYLMGPSSQTGVFRMNNLIDICG